MVVTSQKHKVAGLQRWVFVGFGEAAATLAPLLREQPLSVAVCLPQGRPASASTRRRLADAGMTADTDPAAVADADVVISLVTPDAAVQAAEAVAPHLAPGARYVDLNSISGPTARKIGAIVEQHGGVFVDGAVMGPVPLLKLAVPIRLSGPGAETFNEEAVRNGLHTSVLSSRAGDASSLKMLWSVITKGTIALLAESLVAAHRLGLLEPLTDHLAQEYGNTGNQTMVLRMLRSSIASGERRIIEMRGAARTLDDVSVPTWTVDTTIRWLSALSRVELASEPAGVLQALDAISAAIARPAFASAAGWDGPLDSQGTLAKDAEIS
jgi:3-hydroxyisobutyrate dehydrogenase-like beta-hydroxyacid dehydrogenase